MNRLRQLVLAHGLPPSCFRVSEDIRGEYSHAIEGVHGRKVCDRADFESIHCLTESRNWLLPGRGRHLALAFIGIERASPVRLVSGGTRV